MGHYSASKKAEHRAISHLIKMAQKPIDLAETKEKRSIIKVKELTYLETNRGVGEKDVNTTYKLQHKPR